MDKLRAIAILWLLLFSVFNSSAQSTQTVVTGIIVDSRSQEPLPYASVIFTSTTTGTTTDINGAFSLLTDEPVASLTISFLGYEDQVVPIQQGEIQEVKIELVSASRELEVFTVRQRKRVPKDTLAIRLFRRVIKAKERNKPNNYDTYQFERYQKSEIDLFNFKEKLTQRRLLKPFDFIFENIDTTEDGRAYLAVLFKEKISDIYFQKQPKKTKEKIKAKRISGIDDFNYDEIADQLMVDLNIYENVIPLAEKSFISPFADGARTTYRYFLTDSTHIDGEWCYKLEFVARRKQDLAFVGHAWIHDETAAIKEVELDIVDKINLNYVASLKLSATYVFHQQKYWLKQQEKLVTNFNVTGNNRHASLRLINTVNRSKIKINEPIDPQFFSGETEEIALDATTKTEDYWLEARHEQLSDTESNIYKMVDTVKSVKAYKWYSWGLRLFTSASFHVGIFDFRRAYKFYSWNDIEGPRFRFGGITNEKLSKKFRLEGYAAYGTRDKTWKYQLGFRKHLKRVNKRWHILGGDYAYDLRSVSFDESLFTHDNIASSIMNGGDVSGLLFERRAYLFYEREWIRGLSNQASLLHRIIYAQPGFYDFKYTDPNNADESVEVDKIAATELKIQTTWGHQQKYIEYPFSRAPVLFNYPTLKFDYTIGRNQILDQTNTYHKLKFTIQQEFANRFGYSRYWIGGEKIIGAVPYTFLEIHKGNNSIVYNYQTFALMKPFEFVSDQYAFLWFNHQFDGLILNAVPLINRLKWRSLVRFKMVAGAMKPNNEKLILLPSGLSPLAGVYAETAVGVENVFKVLGFDLVWRLTQRNREAIRKWGWQVKFYTTF